MRSNRVGLFTVFTTALLLWFSAASASAQGITTSALSGTVTKKDGSFVGGATVTIVHDESGTKTSTTTRSNGQYNASGLRPGGPYTITVSAPGVPEAVKHDVSLSLNRAETVNFSLGDEQEEVVHLEKFEISEVQDATFGGGKISTGSSFTAQQIVETPTVRRNVQDIAQLDSRLVVMSLDQGGNLSAQGQNFRFNSFMVDGVQANDPFGLNGNGFSSLRSPVPMEAIQALNVDLNPYDVRHAGFTGALINAVLKSGTNHFHGSITYERTNQDWRAKSPVSGARDVFNERTFNVSFGGPIVKDKLFFFLDYDDFKRTAAPPAANFRPDVTVLGTIIARAKTFNYDPGTLNANNQSNQKTVIGKIDWNISDQQRLTFTYRRNHGEDTNFAGFNGTTATSLSNYWFQQPRNTDSYTAQVFSTWSPNFRTEADLSYTKFDGSPKNIGSPFPQVTVLGVPGTRLDTGAAVNGSVIFGTENSRQLNFLNTVETNGRVTGEYSLGDHTLSFGGEADRTKNTDKFVQNIDGVYTFTTPATWIAGTPPQTYQLSQIAPGRSLEQSFAIFTSTGYGAFVEDSWKPNSHLTVVAGLRLDYPYVPEKPAVAPGFQTAFGIRNDTTNSGNYTVAPRLGFAYDFQTKRNTQIRGGIGLFQGGNPPVWLANAFQNTGATSNVNATSAQLPTIVFNPDVNAQPVPAGTTPTPNISVTHPDYIQPAVWKANLAVDRELGFGGIIATLEFDYLKTDEAVQYEFLNYQLATSGNQQTPDGRERYAGTITPTGTFVSGGVLTPFAASSLNGRRRINTFADVVELKNTNKGDADSVTFELRRPIKNHWGWSASYTRGRATEVSPSTSSVALSNYQNRASFNPNEDTASLSNTNIRDRIVGTLSREFHWISRAPTTVSLVYQGRTGHPYSWVFRGDANGDGFTFNDLFYVPTGPDDPKVRWSTLAGGTPTAGQAAERDAFFAFVNSSSLKNFMGSHPSRNSEVSPWTQTVDIKIVQELPVYRKVKSELYMNLINLGNLIKKSWGLQDEVPFSYRRGVAGATYDAAANGGQGQWIYTYNANTLDPVPITANDTPVSRWQVQAGVRLKF